MLTGGKSPVFTNPQETIKTKICWNTEGLFCFCRNAHPIPHIYMPPNQERTRTGTHREGRGYKKQQIRVWGLENSNTFPYNFIIRSQSQTIKAFHFIMTRLFGDEVKKESNYLLWPLVPHRGIERHIGMWTFERASKVVWGEQMPSSVRIFTRFTKPRQCQHWMPGLPDSQTRVLPPPCTAQPRVTRLEHPSGFLFAPWNGVVG